MPRATPVAEIADEMCRKFPDAPTHQLARKLEKKLRGAKTFEQCRSTIRYVRGQTGNAHRGRVSKAGHSDLIKKESRLTPKIPPSLCAEWLPEVIDYKTDAGLLSDIHFRYHDIKALKVAVAHLEKAKIKTLILNGDIGDWYTISRFLKNPAERDMLGELGTQRDGLRWIRSRFPKARIIFKMGNHDERWDHWLWNHAPEIADAPEMRLSTWLKLDELGIEMVADQRPIMLGNLTVLHGHELPRGVSSPVSVARGAYTRALVHCIIGHSHRTSHFTEQNIWGHEIRCWSTGCLCELHPEYARINKWNHGFALVQTLNNGEFDVNNYKIKDGKVRRD